jgi:hypothetical protein
MIVGMLPEKRKQDKSYEFQLPFFWVICCVVGGKQHRRHFFFPFLQETRTPTCHNSTPRHFLRLP